MISHKELLIIAIVKWEGYMSNECWRVIMLHALRFVGYYKSKKTFLLVDKQNTQVGAG